MSRFIAGGYLEQVHGIPVHYLRSYLAPCQKTRLFDVGCGTGSVLASATHGKSPPLVFDSVLCLDRAPGSWRCLEEQKKAEKLAHYEPKRQTLPEFMDKLKLDKEEASPRRSLFMCWPWPNAESYDLQAVQILQPDWAVFLVATIHDKDSKTGQIETTTVAGTEQLFNRFLAPLQEASQSSSSSKGSFLGYYLEKHLTLVRLNGRLCHGYKIQDDDSLLSRPGEPESHIYCHLFLIRKATVTVSAEQRALLSDLPIGQVDLQPTCPCFALPQR